MEGEEAFLSYGRTFFRMGKICENACYGRRFFRRKKNLVQKNLLPYEVASQDLLIWKKVLPYDLLEEFLP